MAHLLEPLGLGEEESELYLALLQVAPAHVDDLASRSGIAVPRAEAALRTLVEHGLAQPDGFGSGTYRVISPEESIPLLIDRRRRDLSDLQRTLDEMAAAARAERFGAAAAAVEQVRGDATIDVLVHLQNTARHELMIIDAPPYLPGGGRPNDGEFAVLERGVAYRVIYHPVALVDDGAVDHMRRCVEAGEQARVLADVGPKMIVVDRTTAVVVESSSDPDPTVRLVVHESTLLDVLIARFEDLWARAVPVDAPATDGAVSARDRELLALLTAGMKDRAIAHTLGVTERTIGRRVTDLMERLDATTRFRAGVRAAQRGWVPPDDG